MEKVLLIEDDNDLRENVIDLLEIEGYKVFGYNTGRNVMNLITEIMPDIIICDIMLPGMDGYQIVEAVRSNEKTKTIPFIFLTARAEMKDLRTGMNLGANDYLLKPYEAEELLGTVRLRLAMNKENTKPVEPKASSLHEDDTILLNNGQTVKSIKLSQIICITADAEYSEVFLSDKSKMYIRRLMKEWEELLPESTFIRIHKSTIINLNHLQKAEKWFNNSFRVFIQNYPEPIISSRRYSTKIREKLIG